MHVCVCISMRTVFRFANEDKVMYACMYVCMCMRTVFRFTNEDKVMYACMCLCAYVYAYSFCVCT
jgi:hypothetical protein